MAQQKLSTITHLQLFSLIGGKITQIAKAAPDEFGDEFFGIAVVSPPPNEKVYTLLVKNPVVMTAILESTTPPARPRVRKPAKKKPSPEK